MDSSVIYTAAETPKSKLAGKLAIEAADGNRPKLATKLLASLTHKDTGKSPEKLSLELALMVMVEIERNNSKSLAATIFKNMEKADKKMCNNRPGPICYSCDSDNICQHSPGYNPNLKQEATNNE